MHSINWNLNVATVTKADFEMGRKRNYLILHICQQKNFWSPNLCSIAKSIFFFFCRMNTLELEGYFYLIASIGMNTRFFLSYEEYLLFHGLFHHLSVSWRDGISATLIAIEALRCLRCIVHLQQALLCVLLSI